jgi:hypothetical protein
MFVQPFYFISYYFYCIEYDGFFFHFQETYNSQLRERYEDDPSTYPDFDPDLWMEVGSSGGLDKNRVYGLSNTTTENLWAARSVPTIGSSQSISSTQSKEFMALHQHTAGLAKKTSTYRRLMNNTWLISPRNTSNSWRIMNSLAMKLGISNERKADGRFPSGISLVKKLTTNSES